MGTTRNNFAANLRKRRKAIPLTQAQFAEKLDRAVRTYQAYEDGSVAPPPDILDQIASILKCSVIDLYADSSIVPAPEHQKPGDPVWLEELSTRTANKINAHLDESKSVKNEPLSPAIRQIASTLATFNESELDEVANFIETIRRSSARASNPKKRNRAVE